MAFLQTSSQIEASHLESKASKNITYLLSTIHIFGVCFCAWSRSLRLAYFLNSCICCREASQKKKNSRGKWRNTASGCGQAAAEDFTWLWATGLMWWLFCKESESCFVHAFDYSEEDGREETLTNYKKWKIKMGIPLPKMKRSCWNKGRRWRRRRAGPQLWFEVILIHEGTSSSSPSGKTDRVQPHEDNSALPVILPKTAAVQKGKNSFYESCVKKSHRSVPCRLWLKVFSVFLWPKMDIKAAYFQICLFWLFSYIKRLKDTQKLI